MRDMAKSRAILPKNGKGTDGSARGDVDLLGRGRNRQPVGCGAAIENALATVSRKVSELESHLQTKLFNRSSRKLVLTDAGSSYFASCKRFLADVTEAERAASGEYPLRLES